MSTFITDHKYGNYIPCTDVPDETLMPLIKSDAAKILPMGTVFDIYTTKEKIVIGMDPRTGEEAWGYPLIWLYPTMPEIDLYRLIERCTI